jgi:hypothetical protein
MAVYVDDAAIILRGTPRFHMTADSLDELHSFAQEQGIAKSSFHRGARHPHYDVTDVQRDKVLAAGAHAVRPRDIVRLANKLRLPKAKVQN